MTSVVHVRKRGFETRRTVTVALALLNILLVPRMCLGSFYISEAICSFLERCMLMFELQCVKSQNSSRKFVCWHLMRLFPKAAGKRTSLKRKKLTHLVIRPTFAALRRVCFHILACRPLRTPLASYIIGAGFKISKAVLRL